MAARADVSTLALGEIRGVSPSRCVVRTDAGVLAFERRCPHAGADLSFGRLTDGKLRCPWHNLPFDPATGRQPCRSIRDLAVFPVRTVAPGIIEIED